MITVRVDKNKEPVELLNKVPDGNIVSMPNLRTILDTVNNERGFECDYRDLIGNDFSTVKELLNSGNKALIELGEWFIREIEGAYDSIADDTLPYNADKIIAFVLTNSKLDSTI